MSFIKTFSNCFPGNRIPLILPLAILGGSFVLISCRSTSTVSEREPMETVSHRIIGYVMGTRSQTVRPEDARKLTHINYAFANVTEEGEVVLEHPEDPERLRQLVDLRNINPGLKILLSVGGWSWSDYFSNAALTEEARNRFARTAVELLAQYRLDGLDIDWEYPGQAGEDNVFRPEDRENFTLLLETVREHLNRQGLRDGRTGPDHYLLTIAAGADRSFLDHTRMAQAQQYLDFINLMTYDFHGSWTDHTGHLSNLFPPAASRVPKEPSVMASVKYYRVAGVPVHKIVLGVPFYGRGWAGVTRTDNGLYQSYEKPLGGIPYDSLEVHYINKDGFIRYRDEASDSPYLWNSDRGIFITYEDSISLMHKAAYIKTSGLGGVMYWEYSQDHDGTLLNTLYRYIRPEPAQ